MDFKFLINIFLLKPTILVKFIIRVISRIFLWLRECTLYMIFVISKKTDYQIVVFKQKCFRSEICKSMEFNLIIRVSSQNSDQIYLI